jgi:tetratricopeptide (TPR) repeat protein
MAILIAAVLISPVIAAESPEAVNTAGALYSKSVDLANDGKYQEALDAADQALAMNVTSLTAVIQSNRAGILVMLHRHNEAITAADTALAVEGNLTTVHSVAWYNKGNALRALGRIAEARDAYDHAYALDNTLVPPDMSADVTVSSTPDLPFSPTRQSPLSALLVLGALGVLYGMVSASRKK